ncbi:MAG: hypothetical protein GY826_05740, partial [Fuerstiella sp.]|nr:hypothetical protein [Fuerstiella sp.]
QELELLLQKGYTRVSCDEETIEIESLLGQEIDSSKSLYILIDRFKNVDNEENRFRLADSVQTAFRSASTTALR